MIRSLLKSAAIGLGSALFALGLSAPARAHWCTVAATPLAFGTYNPMTSSTLSTVASLTYTCTFRAPRGIKIMVENGEILRSIGHHRGGASSLDDSLHFFLTLDSTGTIPWGDGTGGTQVYFDPHPPVNQPVTVQIYGFMPAKQNPGPGRYEDTLRVFARF